MHGNTHCIKQHKHDGRKFKLVYLHSCCRLANGESASMILHFLDISKLTAPMLLPQPTTGTLYILSKNYTTLSTYLAYYLPNVIYLLSCLKPQPLKSKHANPAPSGNYLRCKYP